jgi:hypothetical protein
MRFRGMKMPKESDYLRIYCYTSRAEDGHVICDSQNRSIIHPAHKAYSYSEEKGKIICSPLTEMLSPGTKFCMAALSNPHALYPFRVRCAHKITKKDYERLKKAVKDSVEKREKACEAIEREYGPIIQQITTLLNYCDEKRSNALSKVQSELSLENLIKKLVHKK